MKKPVSVFLLVALLLQTSGSLVIVAGYEINKIYIAKNFCVNRNKPSMHCYGMCHLKKEMRDAEKKEQSSSTPSNEKQETNQFFQTDSELIFAFSNCISKIYFSYKESPTRDFSTFIFHPPAAWISLRWSSWGGNQALNNELRKWLICTFCA